jgi:hypothetical protein
LRKNLSFWGEWGKGREGFRKNNSLVPWGYHQIHKMFPKMFGITLQIYLIRFAESSTFMYINKKGGP